MTGDSILRSFLMAQFTLSAFVLSIIAWRKVYRSFASLASFIAVVGASEGIHLAILFYWRPLHLHPSSAFHFIFVADWVSQLLELCLVVAIIYGLFREAMRPFPGLHQIGQIVFRWVGTVSFLVAAALAAGPELFVKGNTLISIYNLVAPRYQQGINVLVLCLLLFVCFAIRPLGLTFRSHIFGVVLGLGVYSTLQLIMAAWLAVKGGVDLYSPLYAVEAGGGCAALLIWGAYFALPEPQRRMILLPTTSPFFHWNRISEILGDAPGSVAVAGFTPDMLAPAEIDMLTMAISNEEASAREREVVSTGQGTSRGIAELPAPSEAAFALSR